MTWWEGWGRVVGGKLVFEGPRPIGGTETGTACCSWMPAGYLQLKFFENSSVCGRLIQCRVSGLGCSVLQSARHTAGRQSCWWQVAPSDSYQMLCDEGEHFNLTSADERYLLNWALCCRSAT